MNRLPHFLSRSIHHNFVTCLLINDQGYCLRFIHATAMQYIKILIKIMPTERPTISFSYFVLTVNNITA